MSVQDKPVNKTAILLIATLATFLTPFMGTSLIIALPTIGNDLAVNAILLSWITTGFFLYPCYGIHLKPEIFYRDADDQFPEPSCFQQ